MKYPEGQIYGFELDESEVKQSIFGLDDKSEKKIKFQKSDDHVDLFENTYNSAIFKTSSKKYILDEKKL